MKLSKSGEESLSKWIKCIGLMQLALHEMEGHLGRGGWQKRKNAKNIGQGGPCQDEL